MRNKLIPASENCCAFLGKWQENQKHILECEGEKAVEIRTKLCSDIAHSDGLSM